jgi:3'-phosphoadenosine 5'-phosphosulfate sulfotransferase (PAPS reductase)/FAD synthetase
VAKKYTLEDLKIMQAWPLERKISVAQTRIIEWYERFDGRVAVSFSGGKDSTVLLHIARKCYPDIPAVFVDTGIEFPEVREFVLSTPNVEIIKPQLCKTCTNCKEGCFGKIVKAHGWNFPNKNTAMSVRYARKGSKWAVARFSGLNSDGTESLYRKSVYGRWAFLVDCSYKISDECCGILKERPLDKWYRKNKYQPIVGTLASESLRRRSAWFTTGCNAFNAKKRISKPLSFFTEQDILSYLKSFKVPYASIYGEIIADKKGKLHTTGEKRTGCCLCPVGRHLDKENRFIRLKRTHPDLWNLAINTLGLGEFLDFVGVTYE